jgi:hypothetical protein
MKTELSLSALGQLGMTLAAELARYGVAIRIVDKTSHRTDN